MNNGKVSVIIPVYNVEQHLEQCLDSVVNQTYTDIEIMIVNDGSNDNSSKIIERYQLKYKNIKVIDQENKGVSVARNVALKESTGRYVLYLDSDDYLEENCIKVLIDKIEVDESDMVISNYSKVYDSGIEGENCDISLGLLENKIYSGREIAELMLKNLVQGYVTGKLFKRKNLIENNFTFEEGKKVEDFFPMFKQLCSTDKISYVEAYMYKYRQRLGSTVNTNNISLMTDFIYAIRKTADYAEEERFNKILIERFKLIKSCIVIKNYYMANKDKKSVYLEFESNRLNVAFPRITLKLFTKTNIRSILLIITWRLKIYDKFAKIKNIILN